MHYFLVYLVAQTQTPKLLGGSHGRVVTTVRTRCGHTMFYAIQQGYNTIEPNTPLSPGTSALRLGLPEFGCDFSGGVHELMDIIVCDLCFPLQ